MSSNQIGLPKSASGMKRKKGAKPERKNAQKELGPFPPIPKGKTSKLLRLVSFRPIRRCHKAVLEDLAHQKGNSGEKRVKSLDVSSSPRPRKC